MFSVLVNVLTALLVAAAVAAHARRSPLPQVLRYFTAQSNVLCAFASLAVAAARLSGGVPAAVLLFKYIGTVAVLVTLLTVLVFLGPQYGYKLLFSGPDLWLHLVCPLLALFSWLLWDRLPLASGTALLGTLPVLFYGLLYLRRVVFQKRWEDFYGFNRGGRWPVSFAAMIVCTALLCLLFTLG